MSVGIGEESAAGVDLEGSPVEGLAEGTAGVDGGELGCAKGGVGWVAAEEAGVEAVHELGGRGVGDLPEGSDDVVSPGAEEGPGEAYEAFARVVAASGAVAGGDGDEVGVEAMVEDVAGVEAVGKGLGGGL
jgi:hypothetical protein